MYSLLGFFVGISAMIRFWDLTKFIKCLFNGTYCVLKCFFFTMCIISSLFFPYFIGVWSTHSYWWCQLTSIYGSSEETCCLKCCLKFCNALEAQINCSHISAFFSFTLFHVSLDSALICTSCLTRCKAVLFSKKSFVISKCFNVNCSL